MAITSIQSISDGSRITVSDLVGNPTWIATKLKELMTNQFISHALFRDAGPNQNGLVAYRVGDPMFLDDDPAYVAEFGEIPTSKGALGTPVVSMATKRALGVRISLEMIRENKIGQVQQRITNLKNTFTRSQDRVAKALLQSNLVPTMAASTAWDQGGSPRIDISNAVYEITSAAPTIQQGGSADEYWGFEPDTMVLNPGILPVLQGNSEFTDVFKGDIASENIAYTGVLPNKIYGLDVIKSRTFPLADVLILQRGVVGFYSDTRSLEFTGLYPEGNGPNGGPTETWRCDAVQKRAIGIDQPQAAMWLTGVVS